MKLDFSKIRALGKKQPTLRLRTLSGREMGAIPFVHDLEFEINYTDVSTMSFTVPYMANGKINPLWGELSSYREVYTEAHGIYVLDTPVRTGNGSEETKTVTGRSIEQLFATKNLFLAEGTYNFWNPAAPEGTLLSLALEEDRSWSVGYVAPRLIGCYRTFDEYSGDALSFLYGDTSEKYRCAVVFDPYERTINVYDADEEADTVPIYLSYNNLVEKTKVEELTDELATKLYIYGADGLTVRDVNPTGADYIVDFGFFLENGDLDVEGDDGLLSDKVRRWYAEIEAETPYYTSLVSARASVSAQVLTLRSELTEINLNIENLKNQQSVTVQAYSLEITDEGKAARQRELSEYADRIAAEEASARQKNEAISEAETTRERYMEEIRSITARLGFEGYFSESEQKKLAPFLIDATLEDSTFVSTTVEASASGEANPFTGAVAATESSVKYVTPPNGGAVMYLASGGKLALGSTLSGDVVRATLEVREDEYVMTAHLGGVSYSGHSYDNGTVTMSGGLSGFGSDASAGADGTRFSFSTADATLFFTASVSEFQSYSVESELYDYGRSVLEERARPVYEFSIDSANFLFLKEFAPFADKLEMGRAIHLSLGHGEVIKPRVIGMKFGYEDVTSSSFVFSNRYRLRNGMEKWIEEIRSSTSASRSFDSAKYLYNRVAEKTTQVSDFMDGLIDASVNAVVGATDQKVLIDGAGIHVGNGTERQLRLTDSMIAMTDDGWRTAKVGLGRFASPKTGEVWGINTDLLAGTMTVTKNLVIQNPTDDGTMMFQVDETGAWLYNSRFVMQSKDGLIIQDPRFGIVAGTKLLFDTNGTTVTPEFLDEHGNITFDDDGMPENANFFLDVRDGNAYFRGTVFAQDGVFNGTVYATDGEFTGTIHARDGEFSGTLSAPRLKGRLQADPDEDGWLIGCGIDIGDGKFYVDQDGNLTLAGNINMEAGNITWGSNTPVKYRYSVDGSSWHDTMTDADMYRQDSLDGGKTWGSTYQFRGKNGTNGQNGSDASVTRANIERALRTASSVSSSYIAVDSLGSPEIYGGRIYGSEIYAGSASSSFMRMDADGLKVYMDGIDRPKIELGLTAHFPYLKLGSGSYQGAGTFHITKIDTAVSIGYIGTSNVTGIGMTDSQISLNAALLDLSVVDSINWGNNGPTAVFG